MRFGMRSGGPRVPAMCLLAGLLVACAGMAAQAEEPSSDNYVRLGLAAAISGDARFFDADCNIAEPPPYFGCATGSDGRPIGAYGDFGTSLQAEVAVGRRLGDWLRGEIGVRYLPEATFEGQSNFVGVEPGTAPVTMAARSLMLMATGYVDVLPLLGHRQDGLQPYLSGGIGLSRNTLGEATYAFPTLGAGDMTIVPSGSRTGLAWSVGAGFGFELSDGVMLDIGYRFVDRGEIGSDAGPIRIVREGKADLIIPVGPTQADFGTHELGISIRKAF